MKKPTTCNPPISMCCKEFATNFGNHKKRFYQDPANGLVKESGGGQALLHCPFCGAEIDPVVDCEICRARMFHSRAWIDNGRYLCRKCGPVVREERERRTGTGDAA